VGEGLVGEGDPSVGRCDGDGLEVLGLSWVRVSVGSSGSTSSWVGSFSVVTYSVTMAGAVEVVGCASPSSPLHIVAAEKQPPTKATASAAIPTPIPKFFPAPDLVLVGSETATSLATGAAAAEVAAASGSVVGCAVTAG